MSDTREILIYNDGIYSNLDKTADLKIDNFITESLAYEKYGTCLSPNHTENIIKKIKTRTHITREEVDNDRFKLAVNNGILDVRTGDLTPFDPSHYLISKINIEYKPGIEPIPEFFEYLNTTFKGVEWEILVMQELFGYCLYRDYPFEYIVFMTGDGRNGKGVFFRLLGELFGEHNISSISLDDIVRPKSEFVLCDLYGKIVNL